MVRQAYASAIARATVGAVVTASRLPEALKSSLTPPNLALYQYTKFITIDRLLVNLHR